jgi:acetoin utilization deacetylase AcuC-like enzyme
MKVFYTPEMVAPVQRFSPSPAKPGLLIPRWLKQFPSEVEVCPFPPAWATDLELAHDPAYVLSILTHKTRNGFGTIDPDLTESLMYTVGSMKTAAEYAVLYGGIVCSPTSGFHHAGYREGGGFCTFNGLMVAALAAQKRKPNVQIAILDADMHYGDGTDNILQRLKPEGIRHWSVGESWGYGHTDACLFLEDLAGMVECLLTIPHKVDLLLYQAGADPHIDDPLGGWLTTEQLQKRDQIVFEQCVKYHVPVVWNLAGGYQERIEKVLEIHTNTLRVALDVEQSSCRPSKHRELMPSM